MPLYMCNWENGDISFVHAKDKDDAIYRLDEVGGADAGMLKAIPHFMVHFHSTGSMPEYLERVCSAGDIIDEELPVEFESFGEETWDRVVNSDSTKKILTGA